jgi:hypothetical protein
VATSFFHEDLTPDIFYYPLCIFFPRKLTLDALAILFNHQTAGAITFFLILAGNIMLATFKGLDLLPLSRGIIMALMLSTAILILGLVALLAASGILMVRRH